MASARPFHIYTLLDFSLAGFSVLEQHKVQTIETFFCFPSRSAGHYSYKDTKVAAAVAQGCCLKGCLSRIWGSVWRRLKTFAMVLRWGVLPVEVLSCFLIQALSNERKLVLQEREMGMWLVSWFFGHKASDPTPWRGLNVTSTKWRKETKISIFSYCSDTLFTNISC